MKQGAGTATPVWVWGYRIEAAARERVAAKDAPGCQSGAAEKPELLHCHDRILRTGGSKAAETKRVLTAKPPMVR